MNITGIITEYNPFHKGHKLHLENAIKDTSCDGVICIMSGNFMQRGGPAIVDKWNRAKSAVLNGVDLVIELPLIFALSSAENFAFGAIKILNSTNVVDSVYFGSECGDINSLKNISYNLTYPSEKYTINLKKELKNGLPFHKAREIALSKVDNFKNAATILNNSNNILGIEYIKALYKLNSKINPITLKREGSNYNDSNLSNIGFSSATSIRNCLKENLNLNTIKESLPHETFDLFKLLVNEKYNFTFEESMFPFIKYKLLTSKNSFNKIVDVSEGLDNKIIKELQNSNSLKELIMNSKSKRYTYTRINRILTSLYIGLENYDIEDIVSNFTPYIRVLAFNKNGAKILKEIKNNSDLQIITKLPKKIENKSLAIDLLGTRAYANLNNSISPNEDYLRSPFVI